MKEKTAIKRQRGFNTENLTEQVHSVRTMNDDEFLRRTNHLLPPNQWCNKEQHLEQLKDLAAMDNGELYVSILSFYCHTGRESNEFLTVYETVNEKLYMEGGLLKLILDHNALRWMYDNAGEMDQLTRGSVMVHAFEELSPQ